MGDQGVMQVAQHLAALQTQHLDRGQDALHEAAPRRTLAAERVLPQRPPRRSPPYA